VYNHFIRVVPRIRQGHRAEAPEPFDVGNDQPAACFRSVEDHPYGGANPWMGSDADGGRRLIRSCVTMYR